MKTLSAPHSRPLILVCLGLALFAAGQGSGARGDSAAAGNGFFAVTVEDERGAGLGAFTVTTGPDHPLGEGAPLLFAGEGGQPQAGGSYLSVRSYTTGTDYVQTLDGPASGNPVVRLDEWGDVAQLTGDGYRASYDLPGGGQSADSLRIVSDVAVSGSGASVKAYPVDQTTTFLHPFMGPLPLTSPVKRRPEPGRERPRPRCRRHSMAPRLRPATAGFRHRPGFPPRDPPVSGPGPARR